MSNNPGPTNDPFGMQGGFNQGGFNTPPGVGDFPPMPRPANRQEPQPSRQRQKKEKAPKTATKRLLNKQKVFALLFALIAVGLGLQMTSKTTEETFVVRTSTNIPALSKIELSQVEIIALPVEAIEEGAITATSEEDVKTKMSELLEKGRTRMALPKGHQLHPDDFNSFADLATPLGPNERVLALEASVVSAIGGQLRSGDRVDVIAVIDIQGRTLSNIVASDVEIVSTLPGEQQFNSIAQEQTANKDKGGNELLPADPVPGIYNVRVSVDQAIVLSAAQIRGDLILVLRGSEATSTATDPVDLDRIIEQGATAPAAEAPEAGG